MSVLIDYCKVQTSGKIPLCFFIPSLEKTSGDDFIAFAEGMGKSGKLLKGDRTCLIYQ
jgi:hypothetical protein